MRATIDRSACTGHGLCYSLAPTVYADDSEGFGQVIIDGELPAGVVEHARRGAANCPESAISLHD
ncbi:N/A [soil metagenome]